MKAILLKNGTVLSFGPYDVNEDDEVTQFWCHPVGQTSIDVEYESYTGVNPEEVLVQGSYYDLNTIASYVKQLTLNDFLPEVYSKFHKVPKAVLKELIKMGFRRMYTSVKAGCSISIQYNMEKRFIFHIGGVYTDPEKHIEHYSRT